MLSSSRLVRPPGLGRAGAGREGRVEDVDVERDVRRPVAHAIPDLLDGPSPAQVVHVVRADHLEAEHLVVGEVLAGVERPADPDVHAAGLVDQALLGRAAEGRAVGERCAEVGVPGVEVRVEVDHRDRPVQLVHHPQQGQRDRVVAADGDQLVAAVEHRAGTLVDLLDRGPDVERVAGEVAGVHDLLDRERLDVLDRVEVAQQLARCPDVAGPEAGARAVADPGVERHTHHRHVGTLDLVEPGQTGERRGAGEARDHGRVDRTAGCQGSSSQHLREERLGTGVLGVAEDVGGRALLDDDAAVHEDDAVADLAGEADLVGDHDHRHPVGGQALHHVEDLPDQLGVERRGRLVEEHQRRLHGQRPGDRHPLLLAAGEGAGVLVRPLREPDPLEQRQRLLAGLGPVCVP